MARSRIPRGTRPIATDKFHLSKLRAGGWRGAESAEGAGPRSPPASSQWLWLIRHLKETGKKTQ